MAPRSRASILSPEPVEEAESPLIEDRYRGVWRPNDWEQFHGQSELKQRLRIAVDSAKAQGKPLDHVLLLGPAGMGKTTLARLIAQAMGVEFRAVNATSLEKKADIAALLTTIKPKSVVFIDEIHRLPKVLEEYLYTAMDEFYLEVTLGEGIASQVMRVNVPPFTLVGATTRQGLLKPPFRDRFGIQERLMSYKVEDLVGILSDASSTLGYRCSVDALEAIAIRSRLTPRVALRLLRRAWDYALVHRNGYLDKSTALAALEALGIDSNGLDQFDREILKLLTVTFRGQPVGLTTLAQALGEDEQTLEQVYEPFLIQCGFLEKTSRGRKATVKAFELLGIKPRLESPEFLFTDES